MLHVIQKIDLLPLGDGMGRSVDSRLVRHFLELLGRSSENQSRLPSLEFSKIEVHWLIKELDEESDSLLSDEVEEDDPVTMATKQEDIDQGYYLHGIVEWLKTCPDGLFYDADFVDHDCQSHP